MKKDNLKKTDLEIYKLVENEEKRQEDTIDLIASENYVSPAVLEAMGSILMNKYSEGYSGKRYYMGNKIIDEIEDLAVERAKELFKAEHVNIQPYSGSPANLAVHLAFLKPGDKTMGMSLASGGHLTHGHKVSISGMYFDSVQYGVNDDGYIDYDEVRRLAKKHKPKLIWAGFSAYSRVIDWKKFREIADEVNAVLAVDIAHIAGLVAAGIYPSPVGIADVITTTTHKTLRGPRGAMIMCKEQHAQQIDKAVFPGCQGGPHNHVTAGIAVALKEASTDEFKEYTEDIVKNSRELAKLFIDNGYKVISGGTDNHLLLLDVVESFNLTGQEAAVILEKAGIVVNKNAVPNDPRKPWDPSGIRIGTPAVTTRGMKEKDMKKIYEFIIEALQNPNDEPLLEEISRQVKIFLRNFPVPCQKEV
jgi:glycine hydroxymethyltransferase